jgi:hypothetical protein
MNSADIKREILNSSDKTGIRKRFVSGEAGLTNDDIIEQGNALEQLTKQKGWSYVEAYMLDKCNPALILSTDDINVRATAKAMMYLMQWVQQTILAKNDLLKKQNEEHTTN